MLTSSVRWAACTAPPSVIATSITSTCPRAAISQTLSRRSHQRRCSSSKPSSPADGSKGINAEQSVSSGPTRSRSETEKKSGPRKSSKKSKDTATTYTMKGRDDAALGFPPVPSTQHLKIKDIAASAFFSLHRPLSVTSSFPKNVTDDAFAAIFTPRTRANKSSDVIATLSNTVNKLESAAQQERWGAETDALRAAISSEGQPAETNILHLDQAPVDGPLKFPSHILSGQFRPFNAPPPPMPMDTAESIAAGAEAADAAQVTQRRTYKAVLTVEESTDMNGEVTYLGYSTPLVVEEPAVPTSFLERMNIRQERYDDYRERRAEDTGIWAISVKRQRKLKMKKHKYKKLMRRTRNLRRRLDRN